MMIEFAMVGAAALTAVAMVRFAVVPLVASRCGGSILAAPDWTPLDEYAKRHGVPERIPGESDRALRSRIRQVVTARACR